jgi:antitoxin component YwqK of YwqJK toxin-antitoxin module
MPSKPKNFSKQPLRTNPESNEDSDIDRKNTFKLVPNPLSAPEELKLAQIIARKEQAAKINSEQAQLIYHSINQNQKRYNSQNFQYFQESLLQKMCEFHSTQQITFHIKAPETFAIDFFQYLEFNGFYVNGQPTGFGILVWPCTKRLYYEGNFFEGKIDMENIELYGKQGNCIFEGTIIWGLKEGFCKIFGEDGKCTYQGVFVGGLEEGRGLRIRDCMGRLKFEGSRVNGKCDGECKVYGSGVLMNECCYKLGVKDGREKDYRSDGSLQAEWNWANGKKTGVGLEYEKHGKLWKKFFYNDGKRHGQETNYYPTGEVEKTSQWVKGECKGAVFIFSKNGNISCKHTQENGQGSGRYTFYYDNGKIRKEFNSVKDQMEGE